MKYNHLVGIIGGGAVGRAIAAYYPNAAVYDKYQNQDPISKAADADYIFVAVPTPFRGRPDLTEMDDAIVNIAQHLVNPKQQVIIIKSTVVPGTTEQYQAKYPGLNFFFNPEFLTEKTAAEDFANPDKQVVGYTAKTRGLAQKVLAILPPAPSQQAIPATAAEAGKYAINSYYAFKVIFGNLIYDFSQAMGVDYNEARSALVADARIVDSHFDVLHGGYRGYGGKCLPKDVETLAWLGSQKQVDLGFIKKMIEINEELIKQQTI